MDALGILNVSYRDAESAEGATLILLANSDALEQLRVSFPEHVLGEEVDGKFLLLDIKGGGYYGLNEVGSRIWSLLREGKAPAAVVASLLEEYDVSEEQLRSDVLGFLSAMQSRGLLEVRDVESVQNPEA